MLPIFLVAQNDTLLFEDFSPDPGGNMVLFPSGNDTVWVNFDEDGVPAVFPDVPKDWYSEYHYQSLLEGDTNEVFSSYSYLIDTGAYNQNWLILPPIKLCNEKASIHWKSSSFEGPAYLDGYFLMISTTENIVEKFTTTLFGAAECTKLSTNLNSFDPADFEFSPGYVHANKFTDPQYSFFTGKTFRGRLEPHSYFLNDYANQTVYLAFLHKSKDDHQLDLDDILILGSKCGVPTDDLGDLEIEPILFPNPVDFQLNVLFSLKKGGFCQFSVVDELGKTVFGEPKKWFDRGNNEWFYFPKNLPAGPYFLKLETENGSSSKPFSKY